MRPMSTTSGARGILLNGWAVSAIRTKSGLSQTGFARAVGITQPFLCNIEAGRRRVSPTVAKAIADNLDVPLPAILAQPYDTAAVA